MGEVVEVLELPSRRCLPLREKEDSLSGRSISLEDTVNTSDREEERAEAAAALLRTVLLLFASSVVGAARDATSPVFVGVTSLSLSVSFSSVLCRSLLRERCRKRGEAEETEKVVELVLCAGADDDAVEEKQFDVEEVKGDEASVEEVIAMEIDVVVESCGAASEELSCMLKEMLFFGSFLLVSLTTGFCSRPS